MNRLERGVVYPPEKAQRALQNFFKESTLVALREIALRQTATKWKSGMWHCPNPPPKTWPRRRK